jgi:hypothetical protein
MQFMRMLTILSLSIPLAAQNQKPLASPKATVMQVVGSTEITITYHRPAVKGRSIFGGLVPYGQVWRTGANENTTISFSNDVKINGKSLKAGTYGLHTIPGQSSWTIVFNSDSKAWGSYSYDQKKDALRVDVKPSESEFVERMRFTIDDMTENRATVVLQWEKTRVTFDVEVSS